jgi:hypothetical protein
MIDTGVVAIDAAFLPYIPGESAVLTNSVRQIRTQYVLSIASLLCGAQRRVDRSVTSSVVAEMNPVRSMVLTALVRNIVKLALYLDALHRDASIFKGRFVRAL